VVSVFVAVGSGVAVVSKLRILDRIEIWLAPPTCDIPPHQRRIRLKNGLGGTRTLCGQADAPAGGVAHPVQSDAVIGEQILMRLQFVGKRLQFRARRRRSFHRREPAQQPVVFFYEKRVFGP